MTLREGANDLSIIACITATTGCNLERNATVTYTYNPLKVTAPLLPVGVDPGTTATVPFTVSLSSSGVAGTYTFAPTCAPFTACVAEQASAFINPSGTQPVNVRFAVAFGQANMTAPVLLRASMGATSDTASARVNVGPVRVNSVAVAVDASLIAVGQSTQARATVTYADGLVVPNAAAN